MFPPCNGYNMVQLLTNGRHDYGCGSEPCYPRLHTLKAFEYLQKRQNLRVVTILKKLPESLFWPYITQKMHKPIYRFRWLFTPNPRSTNGPHGCGNACTSLGASVGRAERVSGSSVQLQKPPATLQNGDLQGNKQCVFWFKKKTLSCTVSEKNLA